MSNGKVDSTTKKWALKRKKPTTSKDVPGTGLAKKAAIAIEKRRKILESI